MTKQLRKVVTYLMVMVFGLGLINTTSTVKAQEVEGKIGFSISTLNNPFFVSMAEGAEAKAEELGVEINIVDAGNDTAKQTTDIEDLINSGINVLVVNPVDSASVGTAVQNAMDAGIKVISVDRTVEGAEVDTYIGTDNVIAGEAVGEELLTYLSEEDSIIILEGVPGSSSAIDRHQGFMNALEGNINIVATQTANYDRTEGLTVTENLLQAHPDVKAIVSANDEMALGAIEAINASGKVAGEDILVTGFDAGDDAKKAVTDGTMLFTVEQMTVLMGELAVETAVAMINGEDYESNLPIDVILLDKEALEAAE